MWHKLYKLYGFKGRKILISDLGQRLVCIGLEKRKKKKKENCTDFVKMAASCLSAGIQKKKSLHYLKYQVT